MKIQSQPSPLLNPLLSGKGLVPSARDKAAAADTSNPFSLALGQALRAVNSSQLQAASLQRQVQLGNPLASLEETMVATQKANIHFQAAIHVRNRMVQAYTDIMNMQV